MKSTCVSVQRIAVVWVVILGAQQSLPGTVDFAGVEVQLLLY